ncbi:MAG: type II secretion system protein [Candidatus Shapirobacteria bacterium]
MKNKNFGFTLIETLVVVGTIMLIMASVSGIISAVFNSQNKNKAIDKISQNGGWILNELKKNISNSNGNDLNGGAYFSCPLSVGTSINITNVQDGNKTTIICENNKIASISARGTVYLLDSPDLKIDCSNFVSCSTLPSLQLSNVSFNFNLSAGNNILSSGTSKAFLLEVSLRN